MDVRRQTVLAEGMAAVTDAALRPVLLAGRRGRRRAAGRVGAPRTARDRSRRLRRLLRGGARPESDALLLGSIRTPTLVISGDLDESMPWDGHGRVLSTAIPGAQAVRLPAAHVSNLERPRSFTAALFDFLLPKAARTARGRAARSGARRSATRTSIAALPAPTDFTREFQELITRFAWGTIWARPGLDHRTRRLLVLATTAALGRWEEFRLHVRAGLAARARAVRRGGSAAAGRRLRGVPAANTGFHIAAEEMENRAVG